MNMHDSDRRRREELGFTQAVTQYIGPVLARKGFVCTEQTPYWVKFRSSAVRFDVYHEPLSFEIYISYGRVDRPLERYNLLNMLDAILGPGDRLRGFFQASTREGIVESIKKIADLLTSYGEPALTGDPVSYQRIAEAWQQETNRTGKYLLQGPIREQAETAWKGHDYQRARDLYERIEADLTPLEKARLEYARKQARKPGPGNRDITD